MAENKNNNQFPICVDLDGTLMRTDSFVEMLISFVRSNPFRLIKVAYFLISRGKGYTKSKLAENTGVSEKLLPFHSEFLKFLIDQKKQNRRLILTTGSSEIFAKKVSDHLGIFDQVIASTSKINMIGKKKLKAVHSLLGGKPFAYAGNSHQDIPLWLAAEEQFFVNTPARIKRKVLKKKNRLKQEFKSVPFSLSNFFKAIRIHQWTKNLLIFVPLITAHSFDLDSFKICFLSFLAFGLCASSSYIFNDILDIQFDRLSKSKSARPFANGEFSIKFGVLLIILLFVGAIAFSTLVSINLGYLLLIYFLSSVLYSVYFKPFAIVDLIFLASFFTFRVFVGIVVLEVSFSIWLINFCFLTFFGLAACKRYTEISRNGKSKLPGRNYEFSDQTFLMNLGLASCFTALVIFLLFIDHLNLTDTYSNPQFLWGIFPILLFWFSRIWWLNVKDKLDEDPLIFAIRDIPSILVAVLCIGFMLISR